ncbi:ABC transporter ATP-binding protein [Actinomycetota bacterium]
MSKAIVKVSNLFKSYGKIKAANDVSFEVFQGEIFGLVGPNGAGKTTTIECIEGLRKPGSGNIKVLGLDLFSNSNAIRQRIGIQLQESELPGRIKIWEAMDLFSSFYKNNIDWLPLLESLGIKEKYGSYFNKLSGGQKQKLFISLALVNDPELIFLDELTTGLDPQARRATWGLIKSIRDQGKTIFLTTHYMEEAEYLCDRVAVIDAGKIIALDTPRNLIQSIKEENRLVFNIVTEIDIAPIKKIKSVSRLESSGEKMTIYGKDNTMVKDIVNYLVKNDIDFRDLRTEQANLEDVFLTLTGKEIRT